MAGDKDKSIPGNRLNPIIDEGFNMPEDNLNGRVTALENWRTLTEQWKLAIDNWRQAQAALYAEQRKLDDDRHGANLRQFENLKNSMNQTTEHLNRQDASSLERDKMVRQVLEKTSSIELKLAREDGAAAQELSIKRADIEHATITSAKYANYIAFGSIIVTIVIGLFSILLVFKH